MDAQVHLEAGDVLDGLGSDSFFSFCRDVSLTRLRFSVYVYLNARAKFYLADIDVHVTGVPLVNETVG